MRITAAKAASSTASTAPSGSRPATSHIATQAQTATAAVMPSDMGLAAPRRRAMRSPLLADAAGEAAGEAAGVLTGKLKHLLERMARG